MKITACYIIHYGREWLFHSLMSIVDYVHEVQIFYTPTPSHGHATLLKCPETRDDLIECIKPFWADGYHIGWNDCGPFRHEGEHRTFAVNTCEERGANFVLVVDADEIWPEQTITNVVSDLHMYKDIRSYRIGMRHFWRSLKWVCDDAAMPTRFLDLRAKAGDGYFSRNVGPVFHMGYAQTPGIIEYKQAIHGHKAEWRKGWFENTFLPWKPGMNDVHPTNVDFWTPTNYVDDGELEKLVGDHPYYNLDIIS